VKRLFRYFRPLWEGNDNQISLRSGAAFILVIDFIRNVHNSSFVATTVLNLILQNKPVDAPIITAISAALAQVAIILGVEAALIAALLGLKTYQNTVIGSIPPPGPVQPTEEGA